MLLIKVYLLGGVGHRQAALNHALVNFHFLLILFTELRSWFEKRRVRLVQLGLLEIWLSDLELTLVVG